MMTSERKLPPAPVNPESTPFYEAAAKGRFPIRRCTSCARGVLVFTDPVPVRLGAIEWE